MEIPFAPPRPSRLSNTPIAHAGRPDRAALLDLFKALAYESTVMWAEGDLRIGLASSSWQINQAQDLARVSSRTLRPQRLAPFEAQERALLMALSTSLRLRDNQNPIVAAMWISLDSATGLALDARNLDALSTLRASGARLAELECLALHPDFHPPASQKILSALAQKAGQALGVTHIVTECSRRQLTLYQSRLGFNRLAQHPQTHKAASASICLQLPTTVTPECNTAHAWHTQHTLSA